MTGYVLDDGPSQVYDFIWDGEQFRDMRHRDRFGRRCGVQTRSEYERARSEYERAFKAESLWFGVHGFRG